MTGTGGRESAKSQYLVANQILDIIRDRRMERDERLTEVPLAEQLGVSRTLVRAALKLLSQKNIVKAKRNHGFSLISNWVELKGTDVALPISRDDDLYMKIIQDRTDGKIPDVVTQTDMLLHLKVNRRLLLQTLERMAEEGLVAKNKGHGWTFVPTIDTEVSLRNSYDFRLTIEPAVFRLKTFQIDIVVLNRVRTRHLWLLENAETLSKSGQELFKIDAQFHEAMASFSGNNFFLQAVQHQNRLRRLLEYQGYWNLRRIQTWAREHLDIIDAISASDFALAEKLMRDHLQNAHSSAATSPPARRKPKPKSKSKVD